MTNPLPQVSPKFADAAGTAIGVLDATYAQLRRMHGDAADPLVRNDLMYLSSIALLAGLRGRHFADEVSTIGVDDAAELIELLASTYRQLVEQIDALCEFVVLEFISEVGHLCQGVRRHVENH